MLEKTSLSMMTKISKLLPSKKLEPKKWYSTNLEQTSPSHFISLVEIFPIPNFLEKVKTSPKFFSKTVFTALTWTQVNTDIKSAGLVKD
jgi:hypothetical protein